MDTYNIVVAIELDIDFFLVSHLGTNFPKRK